MEIARQTENLSLYRGDSIYRELIVLDVDDTVVNLTGYTFNSQIRPILDGDILAELHVEIMDATAGTISVYGAASLTDALDLGPDDEGVWDLECVSDAATPIITTAFAGTVTWAKDVTEV